MNTDLAVLFESSLNKIESLEIKKFDDSNFTIHQKSTGFPSNLSITNDERDDLKIELTMILKEAITASIHTSEIQSLISKIHDANTKSLCRLFSVRDKDNNATQKLSLIYIDYSSVFREKIRTDEIKEKDFIIIVLSMFNELLQSIKYILDTLGSIALKMANNRDVSEGDDREEKQ